MHTVAIISDTHMPRRGPLPDDAVARLVSADLIIHAGDHCDAPSLARLRALGPPVVAVHGNVDGDDLRAVLPASAEVEVGGLTIAVVHNGGPAAGRLARLRRRFPAARVIVFGHSHIPLVEQDPDGVMMVNPGSPTDRRRQPEHTMAVLTISGGTADARIVAVGRDPAAG